MKTILIWLSTKSGADLKKTMLVTWEVLKVLKLDRLSNDENNNQYLTDQTLKTCLCKVTALVLLNRPLVNKLSICDSGK